MRLFSSSFCFLLLTGVSIHLTAQNRTFQAENIVIDDDNGNTITLEAPSGMAGSWSLVLPATGPSAAGQALTSDGAGGFSWQAPSGGGGSIPAGYMILSESPTVPTGFSAAGTLAADFWTSQAAMTTARRGMTSSVVNGKVYVIGGATSGTLLATNEEYDPVTNSWSAKAAMTTARCWPASAVYNNKIYVFGGSSAANSFATAIGNNQEYDPGTNTWANKAAMPTAAMLPGAATVGAKIYVMGGFNGTNDIANNQEYDPVANTWAAKTALPKRRDGFGIGVIGGKVYIAGGYEDDPLNTFTIVAKSSEYDPGTNAWSAKADMPAARWGAGSAVVNSRLFILGGTAGGSGTATAFAYDPTGDVWSVKTEMTQMRKQATASAVGARLFVIGGTSSSSDFGVGLSINEEFNDRTLYLFSKN